MGAALCGRAQAFRDGKWVDLPIEIDGVRHEDNVGWEELCRRTERGHLGYVQYDFLLRGNKTYEWQIPAFIPARGFPEGYVPQLCVDGYDDHPDHSGFVVTWFTLAEFLSFDFDAFYHEGFTARQLIGQPCIDYFQNLADHGVERVVLWVIA